MTIKCLRSRGVHRLSQTPEERNLAVRGNPGLSHKHSLAAQDWSHGPVGTY